MKLIKSILKGFSIFPLFSKPRIAQRQKYRNAHEAMAADWKAVGDDLWQGVRRFE